MIENYYGYIKTLTGIERYVIRIHENEVELTTTNRILKGSTEVQVRKSGGENSGFLILKMESDDEKEKSHTRILLKKEHFIQTNVLVGIYASSYSNTLYSGRIILTKINLKPTEGRVISFEDVEGFFQFSKTEEWLSIPSILSYLQKGEKVPKDSEIQKLKKEIEENKKKLEELKSTQDEIFKKLQKQETNSLSIKSINDFKDLVRKGEIDGLFLQLIKWLNIHSKNYINEVLILNGQWSTIQKEFRLGIIQLEIRMLYQNRICVSLLKIIEKIEKNTKF